MEYLPTEIQLKILKNLNFDELFKFKQTNRHFCDFINKYKDELARKGFHTLLFLATDHMWFDTEISLSFNSHSVRNMANNFPLSNHLQEKWLSTLDKQIPFFIVNTESIVSSTEENILGGYLIVENTESIAVRIAPNLFFAEGLPDCKKFTLNLPLFPKSIEELKIIRYWLMQVVRCDFDSIMFAEFIFNPEMIQLLFDNDEINKLKFNCYDASLSLNKQNIDFWKFTFDLVISGHLILYFEQREEQDHIEEKNNFLLKLLLNEGYKIHLIVLEQARHNQILLYNNLINHIETSTDLSKIVHFISFKSVRWHRSQLIIRGIEIKQYDNTEKFYKITNINDSEIVFLIKWTFVRKESNIISTIKISRHY